MKGMKSAMMIGSLLILLPSLGLNGLLIHRLCRTEAAAEAHTENAVVTPDWSQGVRVRSIYQDKLLAGPETITLQQIAREFCQESFPQKVVVFPKLNLKQPLNPDGLCFDFHQIEWQGALAQTFDLELSPGDEVHIHNLKPPLDPFYKYSVTNLGIHSEIGRIGCIGLGQIEIGRVMCSDWNRWPRDCSGLGREIVQIEEADRDRLREWIASVRQFGKDERNSQIEVVSAPTEEAASFHRWSWPAGSMHHRLRSGNREINLYVPEDGLFVFWSYRWD